MASYALPELHIIEVTQEALSTLTPSERRRVLAWLSDYFTSEDVLPSIESEEVVEEAPAEVELEDLSVDDDAEEESFAPATLATFAELYALVAPKTSIQKVMATAYWLEKRMGMESWRASDINKCLKSIDEKVRYLSNTLSIETKREDPRVVTLGKAGDSIQARKTFALSVAGETYVEQHLDGATL